MAPKAESQTRSSRRFASCATIFLQVVAALALEIFCAPFMSLPPLPSRIVRVCAVFLTLHVIHRFAERGLKNFKTDPLKNVVVFYIVLIVSALVVAISNVVALGFLAYLEKNGFSSEFLAEALFLALPFSLAALLVQVVLGLHASLVIATIFSGCVAIYVPNQPLAFPFIFCTSLTGALSMLRFRNRSSYLIAGVNIALVALIFAIASVVMQRQISMLAVVICTVGSLMGGMLSAVLAASFTPLLEYLGGYATDMRLIEMATLDHPLLKELSVQAPGTWNHSMVMGMMVESAANAIGANAVVCRVGALFHDVGKMKKPLYFVENQQPGENRHDKLSPSMSALIIRSHVKEGVELSRKHGVPRIIEDMIPQHHGTSVIEYFYEKASREAEELGEDSDAVDTSLYSYPGPKPQTREAGLLMLADGIEAAARTISDPSHDRIQGMVQKMINKVFASSELDECELTLRDLHLIAKCFTRVLAGIYHQRIAYAEPAEKGNESDDSSRGAEELEEERDEDLKRLGI